MPKKHLTQQFADNPPVPRHKPKIDYFDTHTPGFLLEVRSTGKATYYQRYRDNYGRLKQARIGPTHALSLEKARQKAREIRTAALMGDDPGAKAERQRQTPTLKRFIEDNYLPYVRLHKRSWQLDQQMTDRRITPLWGEMKISDITRDHVCAFQEKLVYSGFKPATVNRYMALVKYIFALAEKWEVIDKSPARGVSKLPENNHRERYLSPEETLRLIEELKNCKSKVVPDIVEFLILTGARKSEAANARWENIDFERCLWTVPLSKSGRPRHIPLYVNSGDTIRNSSESMQILSGI